MTYLSTLTFKLITHLPLELPLNSSRMSPRQLKTSELSALVKRDSDMPNLASTELFLSLCSKVVTSQLETELVASPFMVKNLQMRTSSTSTLSHTSSPWLTLDRILMDLSSSSLQLLAHGLMESMWFLEESLLDRNLLSLLNPREVKPERPRSLLLLLHRCIWSMLKADIKEIYLIFDVFVCFTKSYILKSLFLHENKHIDKS